MAIKTYALVVDGFVTELFSSQMIVDGTAVEVPLDQRFAADFLDRLIETTDQPAITVGWRWDGVFSPPSPPMAAVPQRQFTFLEFMDLFTAEEQLAITQAAMENVEIKLWHDRAVGAQLINLDDPRTQLGLQALIGEGLISPERKNTVMAGQAGG